jgi:excisionase family DNA binding protein
VDPETPQPSFDSPSLTVAETAKLLRVHKKTVYELVKAGELPGRKLGTAIRLNGPSVLAWLQGQDPVSPSKRTRR